MSENLKIFSQNLKIALSHNGVPFKQEAVAKYLGISMGSAWHYMNAKRLPRLSKLEDIAKRLSVNIDFLLTENEATDFFNEPKLVRLSDSAAVTNAHFVTLPIIDLAHFSKNMPQHYMPYYNQTVTIEQSYLEQALHCTQLPDQLVVLYNHPETQESFLPLDWVIGTAAINQVPGLYLILEKKHKIIYKNITAENTDYLTNNRSKVLFHLMYVMAGKQL